ncbi:MAG TPA: oligosaccharide flippase family protein [Candidatus Kapabacteria bacterium]|nr:oligosaccharide flippase family protein [Candidatus Kapabacteria bacterium]
MKHEQLIQHLHDRSDYMKPDRHSGTSKLLATRGGHSLGSDLKNGTSLARTTSASLIINILLYFFLYVGQILIIRNISREEYSIFVISISFIALLALFVDLGLTSLFMKMFSETEAESVLGANDTRGDVLGTILLMRGVASVLVCLFIFFIPPMMGYGPQATFLMRILLFTIIISPRLLAFRNVGDTFILARGKFVLSSSIALLDSILFAGSLFLFSRTSLSLITATLVYTLCSLPGFILVWIIISKWLIKESIRLKFSWIVMRRILKNAFPLILGTAFITIFNNLDPILLDKWSDRSQVSSFGASLRIVTALSVVPMVLVNIVAPEVAKRLTRISTFSVQELVNEVFRALFLFSGGVALLLTTSHDFLARTILGRGYSDASQLFIYLGWSFIPLSFITLLAEISISSGSLWSSTIFRFTMMAVTLISDLFLIRIYGAVGSIVSRMVGLTIGCIGFCFVLKTIPSVDVNKFYYSLTRWLLCISISVVILLLLLTLRMNELTTSGCIILIYISLAFMTKSLTKADVKKIFSYTRKRHVPAYQLEDIV